MLDSAQRLASRPHRVLIAGVTGSGKTTLARDIAAPFNLSAFELDALYHGPGWAPRATFLDDVRALAATERWVTEWQYTSKGSNAYLAPRAELVLWLDYPWRIVRSRLLRRTVSRSVFQTPMHNGNTEKPIWRLAATRDPAENILSWQKKTRHHWSTRMPELVEEFPHLTVVRFRHPRETRRWLALNA